MGAPSVVRRRPSHGRIVGSSITLCVPVPTLSSRNATLREGTSRYPPRRIAGAMRAAQIMHYFAAAHDQNVITLSRYLADMRTGKRTLWIYGEPACTWPGCREVRTLPRTHPLVQLTAGVGWDCVVLAVGSRAVAAVCSRWVVSKNQYYLRKCVKCSRDASMVKMLVHAYTSDA